MTEIDIDALLSGAARISRTKDIEVGDGQTITIHELPAQVIWDHSDEVIASTRASEESGEPQDERAASRRVASMVCRFIGGPKIEGAPTDKQVDNLIAGMGSALIQEIYTAGMDWNGQRLGEGELKKG